MLHQERIRLLVRGLGGGNRGRGGGPSPGPGVLRAGREGFAARERLVAEEYRDRLSCTGRGGSRTDVEGDRALERGRCS